MTDYYYFEENGKVNRIHIENDDEPLNPRTDQDGNVGHMMCWYSRYMLGDYEERKQYEDPEEFLKDLIRKVITFEELKNYIENNKTKNKLNIRFEDDKYILTGEYAAWFDKGEVKKHIIETTDQDESWLEDSIIDYLEISDKLNLLEQKDYYFLPLAVYEHSGITMWCGSHWNHFDAQWDCSDIGWIYTTKKEIFDTGCVDVTEDTWKEKANEWLEAEVEEYDMYLKGECYGYRFEEWDGEDWDEIESCWGYYSKKWGEELAREIANEAVTSQPFITEIEAFKLMEEYTEMKKEEEMIELASLVIA